MFFQNHTLKFCPFAFVFHTTCRFSCKKEVEVDINNLFFL